MAYINKINVDGVEYEVKDENALPAADLPEAINTALAKAKESGEFDGAQGEQGPQGPAGESGVYVGTEAPTDPNVKVWINPNGVATFPMPTADDAGKVLKAKGANEAEWGDAPSGGAEPELLFTGTAEAVSSFDQDIDLKGHKNFLIIIGGTKGEAAITLSEAKLYKNNFKYIFGYYTSFLGTTNETYPQGSVVHNLLEVGNNLFLVDYQQSQNSVTGIASTFQGNSSVNTAPKRGGLTGISETRADGISIKFSAEVASVTVSVYGY